MGFFADTFIFNEIPSEFYDLYLRTINDSGEESVMASSDVQLLTQKLYRKPVLLFFGAEQTPVLSFPLSMYSPDEITAGVFSEISAWLFGQMNYCPLRICQNDMTDIYFNCFLTSPQIFRAGNIIRGITCTVICDSPWGWREPITLNYTYDPDVETHSQSVSIKNESANNFYTLPTNLTIVANIFGGSISIVNAQDASRLFHLTLLPNETVNINCDLQTISSSLVQYPLVGLTDKNFLRLVPGTNDLTISGNMKSVSITYPVAVKIS